MESSVKVPVITVDVIAELTQNIKVLREKVSGHCGIKKTAKF